MAPADKELNNEGVVRSTTLMVPCPWARHAMQMLRDHPEIAFGVHLTVIRDLGDYRYGPLAPKEKVPSLIDEAGDFCSTERVSEFLTLARLDELEVELRAQIEAVLSAGLKPTHLDWHCLHNGGRAESRAIDPGWQVRRADFDFLISLQAGELIRQEGIIVLNYKPLQEVWQGRSAQG